MPSFFWKNLQMTVSSCWSICKCKLIFCTCLLHTSSFPYDFSSQLVSAAVTPTASLFPSSSFSYRPRRVDFALLFTARAKSTWLLQISISLKLDLNQLTNLKHKIIKIILFATFKIKCQKWINEMHKIHLINCTILYSKMYQQWAFKINLELHLKYNLTTNSDVTNSCLYANVNFVAFANLFGSSLLR